MNSTKTRDLAVALDGLDRHWTSVVSRMDNTDGLIAIATLANAVRDQIRPLPGGEAERLAERAERDARTMAPPVPDVTVNGNYTVRAVLPGHPAGDGLLQSWWVACQETVSGCHWVTWEAYKMDGRQAGYLAYNAGNYSGSPDPAANRQAALRDLAERAGLLCKPTAGDVGVIRDLLSCVLRDAGQDVVWLSDVTDLAERVTGLLDGLDR